MLPRVVPRVTRHSRRVRTARAIAALPGQTTLHARGGDIRLDATLALAELAVTGGEDALDRLCSHVARACAVEVCSLYVREPDATLPPHTRTGEIDDASDLLVLRATRGLPRRAVGMVQMRFGEGLTGAAAACARPLSVAALDADARNFAVAGLGEERFPALCAIPLVESGRVIAVLVVQRSKRMAFAADEVAWVASLSAAALVVLIRVRDTSRIEDDDGRGPRDAGGVRVRGVGLGTGCGVGPAYIVPAPTFAYAPSSTAAFSRVCTVDRDTERERLRAALEGARADLAALTGPALRRLPPGPGRRALLAYGSLLEDARLEDAAQEEIARGVSAEIALERTARTYARVLAGAGDAHLRERADEFEEALGRVLDRLGGIGQATPAPLGAIIVATRLGVGGALAAYARRPSGVLLTDTPETATSATLLAALGVPLVAHATGALTLMRGGDVLLVDARASEVLVRPSRAQIADARRRRRAAPERVS